MSDVEIDLENEIAHVFLNRPDKRNAFGSKMIAELTEAFTKFNYRELRAVIVQGRGKSFCAGADLEWMRSVKDYNLEQNIIDSKELLAMFRQIQVCEVPLVVKVHGHVMGGANGIVALADVALAEENTIFSFSEVKLGLVPALISPYVIEKMGRSQAGEKMLTGRKFSATEALRSGLVHFCESTNRIDQRLQEVTEDFLSSGPKALRQTKQLLNEIKDLSGEKAVGEYTAKIISERRMSEEGQEGLNAFFAKKKPSWSLV